MIFATGIAFASGLQVSKLFPPREQATASLSCGGGLSAEIVNTKVSSSSSCSATIASVFINPPGAAFAKLIDTSSRLYQAAENTQKFRYSVPNAPPFFENQQSDSHPALDEIIRGAIAIIREQNYPTENVSISLVELTGTCCGYGGYQDTVKRYPASVVKLFWLIALYGQYEAKLLQPNTVVTTDDEELMAHYSNNGASSRIFDAITKTTSGESLEPADLQAWIKARQSINDFFRLANYRDLNIAHKTFPIPDLGLEERQGRDLQFAKGEYAKTSDMPESRNYLTTYEVARLLYEIDAGHAVSPEYSQRVKTYLNHSTDPAVWQSEYPNSVEDFFGEYLPPDVNLFTKLGYTFNDGRQEAAIIESQDEKTRFILVVFANDPVFSTEGSKLFPEIARYVFEQMSLRSNEQ